VFDLYLTQVEKETNLGSFFCLSRRYISFFDVSVGAEDRIQQTVEVVRIAMRKSREQSSESKKCIMPLKSGCSPFVHNPSVTWGLNKVLFTSVH
jgi:hypothetical protein